MKKQISIESTELATMHYEYALAKRALVTAWVHRNEVQQAYTLAKSTIVLAVHSARDNRDKPIYSNDPMREAEIALRLGTDPITRAWMQAQADYLQAEVEAKIAGMACHLYRSLAGDTEE